MRIVLKPISSYFMLQAVKGTSENLRIKNFVLKCKNVNCLVMFTFRHMKYRQFGFSRKKLRSSVGNNQIP